ncbi:MAG: hypothetical protein WC866_02570 [Patescibacteria group bacterium]|jgi:hypothetical protein
MAAVFLFSSLMAFSTMTVQAATVAATVTVTNVALTAADASIAYGSLSLSTARSTSVGMWDTQSATNTGNVVEDFFISGTDSASWTLGATSSSETYRHSFCLTACESNPTNYTALTTGNTALVADVAVGAATRFDLTLTTPTATADYTQQSVDVVVTATAS